MNVYHCIDQHGFNGEDVAILWLGLIPTATARGVTIKVRAWTLLLKTLKTVTVDFEMY